MHTGVFQLRTAPEQGESLASWYVRVAHRFALRPYAFGLIMWRGVPILNRDIDGQSNPEIWNRLAEANGVASAEAYETTVASGEGKIFERHMPNGKTKWLLRLGVYHRSRRRYGQQFCPYCLADDADPFYRLSWRFSFTTVCSVHKTHMLDRCRKCGHAVEFHRINPLKATIVQCFKCSTRLDRQSSTTASYPLIDLQKHLDAAWANGKVQLGRHRNFPSVDYFKIYGQLLRIVATGPRSQQLRDALSDQYGFDPSPIVYPTKAREFEALDIDSRVRLATMCAPMLVDWPIRFVIACKNANFWATWAKRDARNLPVEYVKIVDKHLEGSAFLSSRWRKKRSAIVGRSTEARQNQKPARHPDTTQRPKTGSNVILLRPQPKIKNAGFSKPVSVNKPYKTSY